MQTLKYIEDNLGPRGNHVFRHHSIIAPKHPTETRSTEIVVGSQATWPRCPRVQCNRRHTNAHRHAKQRGQGAHVSKATGGTQMHTDTPSNVAKAPTCPGQAAAHKYTQTHQATWPRRPRVQGNRRQKQIHMDKRAPNQGKSIRHCIHIVGQYRIYTPYMTVYLVTFLPKTLYIHRILTAGQPNVFTFTPTHFCVDAARLGLARTVYTHRI